jgi:hypothetical protein
MITTTKGDMDEALLDKREGVLDDENELTTWVEYRLPGTDEVVHRSAHVTFKRPLAAFGETATLG